MLRKLVAGEELNTEVWDRYLPAVQASVNKKWNGVTNTPPFNLMFGRKMNPFEDYEKAESRLMSEEEIKDWWKKLLKEVYPEISRFAIQRKEEKKTKFDKRQKIIEFGEGDTVMLLNMDKKSKLDQEFIGPFIIVRKTKGGSYILEDNQGNTMKRRVAPSHLKLVKRYKNLGEGNMESNYHKRTKIQRKNNQRQLVKQSI